MKPDTGIPITPGLALGPFVRGTSSSRKSIRTASLKIGPGYRRGLEAWRLDGFLHSVARVVHCCILPPAHVRRRIHDVRSSVRHSPSADLSVLSPQSSASAVRCAAPPTITSRSSPRQVEKQGAGLTSPYFDRPPVTAAAFAPLTSPHIARVSFQETISFPPATQSKVRIRF